MIQFSISHEVLKSIKHYRLQSYTRQVVEKSSAKIFVHTHPHTEIFFITGGKGYFRTENKKVRVQKGSIIVNNPHVRHADPFTTDDKLMYAVFSVAHIAFSQDPDSQNFSPVEIDAGEVDDEKRQTFYFDYSREFEQIFDFLRVIEAESCTMKPFWEWSILNEFDKFILFLLRNSSLISLPYNSEQKKPSVANNLRFYFDHSYADDITLDKLARLFYTNKYYLVHTFKKTFGVSPIAYLNKLRCEKAKIMIETTDLSITAIATSVGFSSISHFSETYKKHFGITPLNTRKTTDA